MATQAEHFAFIPEVTFGTYLAPTKSYIMRSVALAVKRTYDYPDETGAGRSRTTSDMLEKVVSLSLDATLRPYDLGTLLKLIWGTVVTTQQGVTTAYRHKLLPNDAAEIGSFSGQVARANGVSQAFRGAVPKSFKLSAESKAVARWMMEAAVKDGAVIGGTWADGTAAPASAVAFDTLYPVAANRQSLVFYQGAVLFGGTKALTSGEIVVTGGVAQAGVRRIEITVDLGIDDDDFTIQSDPTIMSAQASKRTITATLDIDQKVANATFLNDHLANTDKVLVADFTGPIIATTFPWLFRIVLPILKVSDAPMADLDGGQGIKRVTVELSGMADSSLAGSPDSNVILQTTNVTI